MNAPRTVAAGGPLRGTVRVPGDKSASHRAVMLSALADGTSTIRGLSPGLDVAATAIIMQQLGAEWTVNGSDVTVVGPSSGLHASDAALDCGNSGTTMRLLAGIVSSVRGSHQLVGDASLTSRPMDRVVTPLNMMGARITGRGTRVTAPLMIQGQPSLRSIEYAVPMPSAQVKSALLLAGLQASGHTVVREAVRTRSTTEDMLRHAGVTVHSIDEGPGRTVTVTPGRPNPAQWEIPGDPSQAAFFAVLGAVHGDAIIDVAAIDAARERVGFVDVLQRMQARVAWRTSRGEVSLHSESSALVATEVFSHEIPSVDEIPALVVAAGAARGVSAFRDMGELRVKESDRFVGAMNLARALGCRTWDEGDDFFVEGLGHASAFEEFAVTAGFDHRMVMASAVAGVAGHGCRISGSETVTSSYPNFFDDLASLL